jgi:multidrug efflux pump
VHALIDQALKHSRTVLLTLSLIFIAGIWAYVMIPKESSPDINIPIIYVSMHHEGISPGDAERLLIRPMETELSSIEGLKEMTATGYQGGANITLEFVAGFDADQALDDVREAVDKAKPELPLETDEPTVNEVNFSLFPVLIVTLSGDASERTLIRTARALQDEIEKLTSVLEAPIAGDRDEQVEIVIDPVAIESYGLIGPDIINFFQRSDQLVAAGNLDTGSGRFAVKVPGLFETIYDIQDMPLRVSGDSVVRTKDISNIRRNFKDPESFARLNGQPSVALEVVKRTGENVIDTVAAVREIVRQGQDRFPEGINVTFSQDASETIKTRLTDLQNNLISAVLLVMIVCVAALGLTSASLVGIAIPGAFLSGILVLYFSGLTVNVVVLFGLILSVGMLVDGAIVVTEYADRKLSEGLSAKDAYGAAAKRMSWPIITSTLTTLSAFAPLLFWPGLVGEFMVYLPITLLSVLISSLLMALIFVPTLGSLMAHSRRKPGNMFKLNAPEDLKKLTGFTRGYVNVLKLALNHTGKVLLLAVVLLIAVQSFYTKFNHGVIFFPEIEPEFATVLVHARGNMSIYEQDVIIQRVENRIRNIDGIETIYSRTGSTGRNDLAEDVIGQIQLEFTPWNTRPSAAKILETVLERTNDLPGIIVEGQKAEEGPNQGKPIQLQVRSQTPDLLPGAVSKIRDIMDNIGGFTNVEDSRPVPGIEWQLDVNRAQAAKFGLDITTIGQTIRLVTNGLKVSEYRPDNAEDEVDVILRYPLKDRSLTDLDSIRVETSEGSVPITNFMTRRPQPSVNLIERGNGLRMMEIKADVRDGENTHQTLQQLQSRLSETSFDPGLQFEFKGEDEDQREAQSFLMRAFVVALFIMAIILVTQFNSFYSAFLILSAVIMSTIGVMIGLMITGSPFNVVMTGIGVIALAGIIVNNNIVLIDTYDVHLQDGMSPTDAALLTGAQRLRPVLLTTITTGLGIMPMVFQLNIDFFARDITQGAPSTDWWVDLSTAIAFGLAFSTPLTLIVTPSALKFKADVRNGLDRLKGRFRRNHLSS